MTPEVIEKWHKVVADKNIALLDEILADDARMHSPVVHTVQDGKAITKMYLAGAAMTIGNDSFKYVREVYDDGFAMLEFETEMDGIIVNGVDMITWNEDNLQDHYTYLAGKLEPFMIECGWTKETYLNCINDRKSDFEKGNSILFLSPVIGEIMDNEDLEI